MSIILLRGFSHSGKDFVGDILCNNHGYKQFAFADSLKKIVSTKVGCLLEQLHSQEGKLQICEKDLHKRTYRQILIDEALHLRSIDSNIFVNHLCKTIKSDNDRIVITDWRYPNEIEVIRDTFPNYLIIPVHIINKGQLNSPVIDISEHQLDYRTTDYTIMNNMNNTIYKEITMLIEYIHFNNRIKEIYNI
jgi:hypothetical protein